MTTDDLGTCTYVAAKDDPSNWHGEGPDDWQLDEDSWSCPHDVLEHEELDDPEYCVFHMDPDDVPDDIDEAAWFVHTVNEESASDDKEVAQRKKEFIGAKFGEFGIEQGTTLEVGDEFPIRLDHAIFREGFSAERVTIRRHHLSIGGVKVTGGDVSFNYSKFAGNVSFEFAEFTGDGDISFFHTEFNDGVSFWGATFSGDGDISFDKATFTGVHNVSFDKVTFAPSGRISFLLTEFAVAGRVSFRNAKFAPDGDISFYKTTFTSEGRLLFADVAFGGDDVSFREADFTGERRVLFSKAEFTNDGRVVFTDAAFTGDGDVSFREVKFISGDNVSFGIASFSGDGNVSFREADFTGDRKVLFDKAEFTNAGRVVFTDAAFAGNASFTNTQFTGGSVSFNGTTFISGPVSFNSAAFAGTVDFSVDQFPEQVSFVESQFSGCEVSVASMSEMDLRRADFTGVDLRHTDFSGSNLEAALFSRANLYGADFTSAKLDGAVFGDARVNQTTSFGELINYCVPYDPITNRGSASISARFTRAVRRYLPRRPPQNATGLGDGSDGSNREGVATTSKRVVSSNGELVPKKDRLLSAARAYHTLERIGRENSLPKLQRIGFVRRQEMHRLRYAEEAGTAESRKDAWYYWIKWLRASVARASLLYGESPWRVIAVSLLAILFCGALYPLGGFRSGDPNNSGLIHASSFGEWLSLLPDGIYFSTLTFTTLGFGDFQPAGWGRFLATGETALGATMIALLVFVLGRRAAR